MQKNPCSSVTADEVSYGGGTVKDALDDLAPITNISKGNKELVVTFKDSNNDTFNLMFRANASATEKITMYDASWNKVWGIV